MNDYLITILTCNFNTSDFLINTLYSLKKLTKNKYKVIIRDNNSKYEDYFKLFNYTKDFNNIELYRVEGFKIRGSLAHGMALNDLFLKVKTKYCVILDPDFTFLIKNWDDILINELDEKCPIIGTQGPRFKYQDFPYIFGILFKSNIFKELEIDFRPKTSEKNPNTDTGYKLREKCLNSGYNGKLLKIKDTRFHKSGPFHDINCQEFYLNGYKKIFASHFFRGHSSGFWKYYSANKKKISQIPFIGKKLVSLKIIDKILGRMAKIKGLKEKSKWLKRCRKIVEKAA